MIVLRDFSHSEVSFFNKRSYLFGRFTCNRISVNCIKSKWKYCEQKRTIKEELNSGNINILQHRKQQSHYSFCDNKHRLDGANERSTSTMVGKIELCKSSHNKWDPYICGNPLRFHYTAVVQKISEKCKRNQSPKLRYADR